MKVEVVQAHFAAANPAALDLLENASSDDYIPWATYLPSGMDREAARQWALGRGELSWGIRLESEWVGWLEFKPPHPPRDIVIPSGVLEREVWLLPHARGLRVVQAAMALVMDTVRSSGAVGVVGVAWAVNTAAVFGMRNAGFERLGCSWWGDDHDGGLCEVWMLTL